MTPAIITEFRKSSYSAQMDNCVELARTAPEGQAVRDSKQHPSTSIHFFTPPSLDPLHPGTPAPLNPPRAPARNALKPPTHGHANPTATRRQFPSPSAATAIQPLVTGSTP
ncbi:DUF397 domain-containing protein [Streptomyces acidiscabies]|uniref:DUF397 domain-containing protein n=1 Tax=Streptomyces acidiscabies TaxID=42234 RepID=UPI000AB30409|nr:DUF397 domain-containing protein [Streptomyces acidiscabies]